MYKNSLHSIFDAVTLCWLKQIINFHSVDYSPSSSHPVNMVTRLLCLGLTGFALSAQKSETFLAHV